MTAPEATLFSYLSGLPEVDEFLSQRVYPLRLPPGGEFPAMTYQLTASPRERTQTGVSLIRGSFRCFFWGKVYDDTVEGARRVNKYLEGGDPGGPIHRSLVEDERDWEPEVQSGLFRRLLAVVLWYDPSRV